MKKAIQSTWMRVVRLCTMMMPPHQNRIPIREKAIAVAERVSLVRVKGSVQVSCPVCLEPICGSSADSDLKMTLAIHMSLWHPEDVKLQWDIMNGKKDSNLHVPSLIIGVGIAAGCGALLAFMAKNKTHAVVSSAERLPRYKMK